MKKYKGFTLLEVVVVTGIFAVLALLTSAFLVSSMKNYRIKRESVEFEDKAAAVMRDFEQNIRAASKIELISDNEIIYYRFFDGTSISPKKVRYFMQGNQFKIGVTDPYGTAPNVTYPTEKIELVVGDVANGGSIFQYYDANNVEVKDYTNIPAVTMVKLSINLDKDPAQPPAMVTESTVVSLRNMKRNL